MGPSKQLIAVPFAAGIDTKTDPKQVVPGKLLDLQNGVFQQSGLVNRRWGYTALGNGIIGGTSLISSAKAVNAFGNELLLYDGQSAYSFIQVDNAWAPRGTAVSVIQTNQQIVRNNNQQLSADFGTLGGVEVYAWEDSRGGIRYSVTDAATGSIILNDSPLYAGMPSTLYRPKVIPFPAANMIAVFFVMGDGSFGYVPILPGNPTKVAVPVVMISSSIASGAGFGVFYDINTVALTVFAGVVAPAALLLITPQTGLWAYYSVVLSGGVLSVNVFQSTGSGSAAPVSPAINGIAGTTNFFMLLPASLGNVDIRYPSNEVQAFTGLGTVVSVAIYVAASGVATLFAESAGVNGNVINYNTVTSTGVLGFPAGATPVLARGVGLASKPFSYLGVPYINVAFQSPQQATYFTLRVPDGVVVAKALQGTGGGYVSSQDYVLPECAATATPGIFKYANLVKGVANTESGTVLSLLGVNATKLDFIDSNHFLSSAINGGFYTVGGILQGYDGAQYVEQNFHVYPEGFTTATSGTGGLLGTGAYAYAVTYEWTDNTGGTQISSPSLVSIVNIASGSTNSVTLTIPTLRLTKKQNVKIVVYRSAANGTLLYRVTSAILPLYNVPTQDTVSFIDTLADTSITSNGLMYTQPLTTGTNPVLPNSAPPACSLIATFDNRIFIAGVDDPYTLWYSQQAVSGIPMQFSPLLTLRIDPDGGPITAIARMDGNFFIFKSNAIFYISGTGPTPTGDNSSFAEPVMLPSGGVGCVNANAVVLTPIGLMFQSANGIYLLDRGLNVVYKGAPLQAFNGLTLASANLIPNQWVVFTSSSGTALVYDYYYDQWATFTNHAAVDADLYLGAGNLYVWAASNGIVYQQTPTTFSDAGEPIQFSLTTAWINPGTIQGYQRVYHAFLLGQYKGTHTLNVFCGFDYDDAFTALALIPSDTTLGISTFGSASPFGSDSPFGGIPGGTVYQFRLDILRKCQAIRFQITDTQSYTTAGDEGFSLSALSLLIGVKTGGFKLPAGKQFGVT